MFNRKIIAALKEEIRWMTIRDNYWYQKMSAMDLKKEAPTAIPQYTEHDMRVAYEFAQKEMEHQKADYQYSPLNFDAFKRIQNRERK